jgi:outer membrane protein TolC
MRLLFVPVALAVALMATDSHGGYRELNRTFEAYEPPPYVQTRLRHVEPVPRPEAVPGYPQFEAEKRSIAELAERWEKALTITGDEEAFFRPDGSLFETLRPAGVAMEPAADAVADRFSLEVLETLAILRNPGIKAAQNRLRAAIETFSQVTQLDEILRRYTAFTEALMPGVGPMKGKEPIEMKFPFPGVLSLKGQVVNQTVKVARENLETARRDAVTAVRQAHHDLLFIRKAQTVTERTLGLLRDLEGVAGTRYEAGRTSFQDVIKVRIKRQILEEALVTLGEKRRNLASRIRELIDLPPETPIGRPQEPVLRQQIPALDPLYKTANEKRQELRRLRAMIGKTERMIEMAETMILPRYTLNLSLYQDEAVMQVGAAAVREPFAVVTEAARGAGLPKMPWYGTQDPYLRQTRQNLDAMRAELQKASLETNTLVRRRWFELDRAMREHKLYRESITTLSQSALDVSTRSYEAGSVSFADVIDSYMTWLDAYLMMHRKQSDLGIAWAQLEKAVGSSAGMPGVRSENG